MRLPRIPRFTIAELVVMAMFVAVACILMSFIL